MSSHLYVKMSKFLDDHFLCSCLWENVCAKITFTLYTKIPVEIISLTVALCIFSMQVFPHFLIFITYFGFLDIGE